MEDTETKVLTKQGKKDLEEKLNELVTVEEPKAVEDLNAARSQGDLSENNDYDAAREHYEKLKQEISKIQAILDSAKIVDEKDLDLSKAGIASNAITVENLSTKKQFTFRIVGTFETDPLHGKISNSSPVAKAIRGHSVGDIVVVHAKADYEMKIIDIK